MAAKSQVQQSLPPDKWVDAYGDYLYRYAFKRLNNHQQAEDIVQETLLAALKSQKSFAGKSSQKTWMIGILKHKIIDLFRKNSRESNVSEIEDLASFMDSMFDQTSHFAKPHSDWGSNPESSFEKKEFWKALGICVRHLPEASYRVFTMRMFEDHSSEEICKELGISPNNLWVILHRARLKLKQCMDINWFSKGKS